MGMVHTETTRSRASENSVLIFLLVRFVHCYESMQGTKEKIDAMNDAMREDKDEEPEASWGGRNAVMFLLGTGTETEIFFWCVFQVIGVIFVSATAIVVMLDCVSPMESCDTWWLMFCLCFNGGGSSYDGGSCWDVVLFFTLRRPKNYAWS
ncbi:hypothetical protein L3X38_044682 [Prunus dulcis]|uniref:Uncharacterized protein n=1 Tax=Prunus dulcis TaxID=3755 RepID=A0AAD4V0K6_PRUDU|nr:hypothetical protein L3X38_044682 [Prunus dulcis]